jgi:hypothetical protein
LESVGEAERKIRRLCDLADETVGPSYIPVLDMREGPVHLYVDAYCISDISDLVPGLENQELRKFYIDKFTERTRERAAVCGDTDALMDGPAEELRRAGEALMGTAPTTMPGLLALLVHVGKTVTADPYFIGEDESPIFMATLGKSARQL